MNAPDTTDERRRLAAFEALTEGNFFTFKDGGEGQDEYIWQLVDAVLDAYLKPAAQEEGKGTEEERREYRVNAHDGIYGPYSDVQAALWELGEHQASWHDGGMKTRAPNLESRVVGPWEEGRNGAAVPPSRAPTGGGLDERSSVE